MAGHAPTLIRSAIPPSTDIPAYDDPLLGVSLSTARRDVPVTDGNSLAAALLNAQPGDTIILEEGRTYTQNESIRAIGTATQPIIIKGSTGAAWNGVVRLYGQYIYLMGVDLSTGAEGVVVLAGFCNKILACKFGNQEASNAISLDRVVDVPDNRGGRYGEIAYCDFGTQGPNPPWQPGDDFPGFRQQIKMFTDSVYNPSADKWGWDSVHIDGWIHHNNFHDSHPKADPGTYSSGDNDIIEFGEGDSQEWVYTLSTNWYVEYNIFQNNNNAGNALIDFKTRGNICRGNTCIGNFSQGFWSRTGGAIQYISNWMDYTWGRPYLTLRDSNNIAIKNYMDGGQIDDFSGDRPYDTYPRGSWGQYPCAFNSKIMSNTGGCDIHVGEKFSNQGELPAHAENTLIEDQATNSISFRAVDGTPQYLNPIDNRFDPPSINAPDAVQLTTADVGPDAITNAPLSWSSPRGVGTISQGEAVYVSSFETGAIQDQNVSPDGWNEQTMLSNCPGHLYCVPGRDYSYSSQVLPSATDTGVGTVLPRAGNYFWRAEIREGDNPLDGDHSPRSQLKIGSQSPGRIKYGVKSWVQLSIYRPSARASVFDNEDLTLFQMSFYPEPTDQSLIAMQFEYVNNAHAPSKGWTGEGHIFTLRYFDGNSVVLVPHADLGRSNQIPTFADEWVDWRLELKSHATNGEAKLWYRRPEAENVWVQVVDIKSSDNVEIGWVGKDYLSSISCYGGPHTPPVDGSVYVPSIVCYFDEFRVSDETAGTIESVEITSSPQVSPVTPGASQQSIDLLQQITEFPRLPRQIFSGHHVASFHSANDVPNAWDDTFEPGGYIYELHQLTGVWPWLWGVNWDAAWVGEVHDPV
jgi:hypothetical protein